MISFIRAPKNGVEARIVLLDEKQKSSLLKGPLQAGEIFPAYDGKTLCILLGIGDQQKLSLTQLRIYLKKVFLSGYLKRFKDVEIVVHEDSEPIVVAVIEGYVLGSYIWDKYKSKDAKDTSVKDKNIMIVAKHQSRYDDVIAVLQGTTLARDLVNENADVVTSEFLEKTVRHLVKGKTSVSLEILNEKELKAKGLNLHVAVNQGSNKEPKLIIVKYSAGKKDEPYTAVVGKGLTYDTGGLNLKPTGSIETMKIDMAGAAAVCGILKNVLSLSLKRNLIFVLGVAENAIGPGAYKPGDVFVGYAGKSVEIGNTDAEGRLVLADALAYLVKNYKPAQIIDLATLTGACVVALGFDYTGLFSNNDRMANDLLASAAKSDDWAWRLPIYPEMKEHISSPIADLKNTSHVKGAGASTAATFLQQFVGDTPWVHLDIAGSSFVDGSSRLYFNHGATGSGVRLVTQYLLT